MYESKLVFGYNQFLCAESLVSGSQFNLSLFEDLNKLIEAVVLYDKVVLLGDYQLPSGILSSPLLKEGVLETLPNEQISETLKRDDVRQSYETIMQKVFGEIPLNIPEVQPDTVLQNRISPNFFDSIAYSEMFNQTILLRRGNSFDHKEFQNWMKANVFDTRNKGGHYYYLARAALYTAISESRDMDYGPDLLRLPIAATAFKRDSKSIPKRLYDELVKKVKSEIEALTILGMPITIFVPPLTAKLLDKVDLTSQYPEELLELRDKFKGFRTAYANFQSILKDPTESLKNKIEAKKQMISRITGIIDKGETRNALNIKTVWDKLINSSLDEDGPAAKLSLSGMVSLIIDQVSKETSKGKARALFDLWSHSINMSDHGEIIQKAFKSRINEKEVLKYQEYSQSIRAMLAPNMTSD